MSADQENQMKLLIKQVETLTARVETMSEILKHTNRAVQRTEAKTRSFPTVGAPRNLMPIIERKAK